MQISPRPLFDLGPDSGIREILNFSYQYINKIRIKNYWVRFSKDIQNYSIYKVGKQISI